MGLKESRQLHRSFQLGTIKSDQNGIESVSDEITLTINNDR